MNSNKRNVVILHLLYSFFFSYFVQIKKTSAAYYFPLKTNSPNNLIQIAFYSPLIKLLLNILHTVDIRVC